MSTLVPILSTTPGEPLSYNPSLAETFSWIPVAGSGRPLYARASYIINAADIGFSLSAGEINVNLDSIESLIKTSNTLLEDISAKDLTISLDVSAINLNTDEVESLIKTSNTLLDALTAKTTVTDVLNIETKLDLLTAVDYSTSTKQDQTNTLLDSLTALQEAKQNEIITLLNVLTANTDEIEINLDNLEINTDGVETLLDSLTSLNQKEFDETQTLLNVLTANTDSIESLIDNSNTRLDILTATDFATSVKQDSIITLLHQLTSNTDEIEINLDNLEINTDGVETLLDSLTALSQKEFDETQTLLDALTAQQNISQSTIITLLDQLTANTDQVESLIVDANTKFDLLTGVDYATSTKQDSVITLLDQLTANTDSIESLLQTSNSLLDSISAKEMTISLDVSAINVNTDEIESLIKNSNTLLDALTAKVTVTDTATIESKLDSLTAVDYATEAKQDSIITLLDALTAKQTTISLDVSAINLNTDEVESLIKTSNTLLDALTAKTTVTDVLNIETKLDLLTAVDYSTSTKQDQTNTLLDSLTTSNIFVPGWSIPPYDEISFEYVGSTDIFRKVIYLNNSTQVLALSFVYVTEPPTTGNAIIQTVKKI